MAGRAGWTRPRGPGDPNPPWLYPVRWSRGPPDSGGRGLLCPPGLARSAVPQPPAPWGPPSRTGGGSQRVQDLPPLPTPSPHHLLPHLLPLAATPPLPWGPVLTPRPDHSPGGVHGVTAPGPVTRSHARGHGLLPRAPGLLFGDPAPQSGASWGADPRSGAWPATLHVY